MSIKRLVCTKIPGDTDMTVNIYTSKYKYVYFHVKPNISKQVEILFKKGYENKIWSILKEYEYGREDLKTGEKILGDRVGSIYR
jgi:hypothetical protein